MIHYIRKTAQEAHLGEDAPVSERHKQTRHLPKDQPAADRATSSELVMRASDNVLMVQQSSTRLRGYASVFGLFLLATAPLYFSAVHLVLSIGLPIKSFSHLFAVSLALPFFVVVVGSIFLALRTFRVDLLTPTDNPLVFNRKTRKVYRVMPDIPQRQGISPPVLVRHWLNTFRSWPMQVIEYDWDCLEAEYFSETVLAGNVVR